MIISLLVYVIFNKYLPNKEKNISKNTEHKSEVPVKSNKNIMGIVLATGLVLAVTIIFNFLFNNYKLGLAIGLFVGFVTYIFQISTKEERPRINSLVLVFVVVIFFWMSFHQNGLALTFFARDYTVKEVDAFTNIFFNLNSMLSFIATVVGFFGIIFRKKIIEKIICVGIFGIFGYLTYHLVSGYSVSNSIEPEIFQSFNPLFIVALTFPVMGIFSWLRNKNSEPSTPKKIGIGMFIAAIGFIIIVIASLNLISPHELQYIDAAGNVRYTPVPDQSRVMPYWLISNYLILTIAELFLSPMGISFVSKVAPSRFQGLMQGGWFLATAVGNKLLFIGSDLWGKLDLWQLWSIFVICCILSAIFVFSIMKQLEKVTK